MAIFAGQILREHNMETAAILAMESTHNLIAANQDQKDRNNGLPIENALIWLRKYGSCKAGKKVIYDE